MGFKKMTSPAVDWYHVTQDMQQCNSEHGNERLCCFELTQRPQIKNYLLKLQFYNC